MVIETRKPEETYELGRKMGREAEPGQIVCLSGDLGVGKTVFTQGFAAGLGIEGPVNSPTFTILQHAKTAAVCEQRLVNMQMRTVGFRCTILTCTVSVM